MSFAPQNGLKRIGPCRVFIALEGADAAYPAGAIIIPRRFGKPNVYATAYDAFRSRAEIMLRYGLRRENGGELAELDVLREQARDAHVLLVEGASADEATSVFGGFAHALKRKRNLFKREARAAAASGPVLTSRANVNPGATRARVTAIDRRLDRREGEVRDIASWMGAMETALLLEIRRSIVIVRRLESSLHALDRHALLRTGKATARQREGVATRLNLLIEDMASLEAGPFLALRKQATEHLARAAIAARTGSGTDVRAATKAARDVAIRMLVRNGVEGLVFLAATSAFADDETDRLTPRIDDLAARLKQYLRTAKDPVLEDAQKALPVAARLADEVNLAAAKDHLKALANRL